MNEIMQEVQDLETRLQAAETRKNQLHDQDQIEYQNAVNEYNMIANKLSEKRDELSKAQEKEQRDQRQQEMIQTTTSVDILAQMFDSLFPAGQFEVILGPNRYDVLSQDYKQMIQAYVTEALQAAHQQHDLELAQKDERIKLLNDQSLAVQQQLDEEKTHTANLELANLTRRDEANALIAELRADVAKLQRERDEARQEATAYSLEASDLQAKIAAAEQPKAESKPSQTLSEMMTAIKNKNETQADEWIARFNARQKSDDVKIPLPEVKVPAVTESPFRPDNQAQPAGDQLPSAETPETVGARFPEVPAVAAPVVEGLSTVQTKSIEERVAALEAAVYGKEQVA